MATAAETQSILQLVVGMVNAAPGADILAELEAIVDSGVTIEELAVAIAENPAFSGDTGLFPDFLPNAIFAENFLTQLIGSEVTKEVLAAAVDGMTAGLNAGTSRGAAMNAAIDSLAASTDSDFADASAALSNKVEVAEYYSVTLAASSTDLDDLIAVVSAVTSDEDAVKDGTDAVDDAIIIGGGLGGLLTGLASATADKKAFLVAADLDGKATTTATDASVAGVAAILEGKVDAVETGSDAVLLGYAGKTTAIKAAVLVDYQAGLNLGATTAAAGLTSAQSVVTGTGKIAGLEAAILADVAAMAAVTAAGKAQDITEAARLGAEANYEAFAVNTAITVGEDLSVAGIIALNAKTKVLSIAPAITESTNPGVTALLAALQTDQAALAIQAAAVAGELRTTAAVENIDRTPAGFTTLAALTAGLTVINPATAKKASAAEIAAEKTALDSIVALLNTLAVANGDAVAVVNDGDAAGLAQVITTYNTAVSGIDIDGESTNALVIKAHAALTAAAVADGYITAADGAKINAAFDALQIGDAGTLVDAAAAASATAIAANSASGRVGAFAGLVTTYGAATDPGGTTITSNYVTALFAMGTAAKAQVAFDKALASEAAYAPIVAGLKAANADIAAATAAFATAGFEAPQDVDSVIEAATLDDDIFVGTGVNSQILSFGGDDVLFVGVDTVLNSNAKAGVDGDNAVTEVWITGTTSAVITVETSEFGSDATVPEVYTITLTGVAAADVSYADGFVTIG